MNKLKILGITGYAQSGKDTAASYLRPLGVQRFAFADNLKADLRSICQGFGCDLSKDEDKIAARNLLVAYGETARRFDHDFFCRRVFLDIGRQKAENVVITDVRYANEVEAILQTGGRVIYIHRPQVHAANETELNSINKILGRWDIPAIINSGTKDELGEMVVDFWRRMDNKCLE